MVDFRVHAVLCPLREVSIEDQKQVVEDVPFSELGNSVFAHSSCASKVIASFPSVSFNPRHLFCCSNRPLHAIHKDAQLLFHHLWLLDPRGFANTTN